MFPTTRVIAIADFLIEISDLSVPGNIRAVKNFGGPDIAALIWDKIEAKRALAQA